MIQKSFLFVASAVFVTTILCPQVAGAQLAQNPALRSSAALQPPAPAGPPPAPATLTLYTDHAQWLSATGGGTTLVDFETVAHGTQITTQFAPSGITSVSGTSTIENPPGPTTQAVHSSQLMPFPMFSAGLLPSETMFLANRMDPGVFATGAITFGFAGSAGAVGAYVADSSPISGFAIELFGPSGSLGIVLAPSPGLFLPSSFIGVVSDVPFTSCTFFAENAFDSWGLDDLEFTGGSAGTGFCFGDGTGTPCPCGNAGLPGHGCASSANAGGAKLSASGAPSISNDTFVLTGSGMPNSFALYFQGGTQQLGGAGSVFGDGLRCAGNPVVRLGIELNNGGASSYPQGFDPRISVKGANSSGAVRTYQVWYRNAAPFCVAATFNLTNGFQVTWLP